MGGLGRKEGRGQGREGARKGGKRREENTYGWLSSRTDGQMAGRRRKMGRKTGVVEFMNE